MNSPQCLTDLAYISKSEVMKHVGILKVDERKKTSFMEFRILRK